MVKANLQFALDQGCLAVKDVLSRKEWVFGVKNYINPSYSTHVVTLKEARHFMEDHGLGARDIIAISRAPVRAPNLHRLADNGN